MFIVAARVLSSGGLLAALYASRMVALIHIAMVFLVMSTILSGQHDKKSKFLVPR